MNRPVTVADMLCARDERAARQAEFRSRHGCALVSFTMNVAGEIKVDAAILRAFQEGVQRIEQELSRMNAAEMEHAAHTPFTGCEALWAVDADAHLLKQRMQQIEESCALGRLFDIDVIDAEGQHLSRGNERACLICGGPVRACARSRTHSVQELSQRTHEIIEKHFQERFIRHVGALAQKALLYEAALTPKPGLVDCRNSGAHQDMDLYSFLSSACVLRPYFEDCVRIGMQGGDPERLQYAGMQAEDAMLAAAGANTHKGAVFALGILCCAAGCCGEATAQEDILARAAELGRHYLDQMAASDTEETGGEKQYRLYGLPGARGEAAAGFPSVTKIALPVLEEEIARGASLQQAGRTALLHLMATVKDSNVIRRAGMPGQAWVSEQAVCMLKKGFTDDDLIALDDEMIRRGISPGGCADLLAVTMFLHFMGKEQAGEE